MASQSTRMLWADAVLDADESIDAYARAVAFALMRHMDRDGMCRPSTRRIATMAGCARNVAMDRIHRLEEAGFLTVERRHRAVSVYRAALPSGSRDEPDATGSLAHSESQITTGPEPSGSSESQSGSSESQSGSPGEHRTLEPSSSPTTSPPTTSVGEKGNERPKGRVTPQRILAEMARRRLGLAREQSAAWAPEEGCDPRREKGWLDKEVSALKGQYGFELDNLIAKWKPDQPAPPHQKWRNDPDWYVWKLDRRLARRDWMQPTWQETREKHERERAEYEAACAAADPDEVARGRQAAMDLAERLKTQNAERQHGLRLITNEQQVPA